ncbi:dihydrofolate reductase family protein [Nocardia sp. NPDC060259]|uniref:dihydrofolate reductase family protein n=1 Tax=Nocardia sp. NPDC060259 TaxID=3347088 RepID=UPI00365F802C
MRFVAGEVAAVHEQMVAAAAGRDIWIVGGGDLAGQFADAGLLDEVIVGITPVTLGGGAPLLPRRILADRMRLVDVERMGQFAKLVYRLS